MKLTWLLLPWWILALGCASAPDPTTQPAMRMSVSPTTAHPGDAVQVSIEFQNTSTSVVAVPKGYDVYLSYHSADGSGGAGGSKHSIEPEPRLRPGQSLRYTKEFVAPWSYGPVKIFTDVRKDVSTTLEVVSSAWENTARLHEAVLASVVGRASGEPSGVPSRFDVLTVEKAILRLWEAPDERLSPCVAIPAAAKTFSDYFVQYYFSSHNGQLRIVGRGLHRSVPQRPELPPDHPGNATFGFTYLCSANRLVELTFGVPLWQPQNSNWARATAD
jgi:hypothetical protein